MKKPLCLSVGCVIITKIYYDCSTLRFTEATAEPPSPTRPSVSCLSPLTHWVVCLESQDRIQTFSHTYPHSLFLSQCFIAAKTYPVPSPEVSSRPMVTLVPEEELDQSEHQLRALNKGRRPCADPTYHTLRDELAVSFICR